jgi:two-component system NtrC family sensor kinase
MTDNSVPEHLRTISSRIYDSALRASRIVRNLREFARQREAIREPVDLRQVVDKVIELLDYEFTQSGIKILKDYEDIPSVMADSAQLQQVVLNLFKNAHDAIVETGRGEGTLKVSLRKGDGLVIFEVSDDGIGIPEELINRIFEPFFTTKPVGKGTGLGLSITYGIIKAHNGNISVKSKHGEGTTFTIELPIS